MPFVELFGILRHRSDPNLPREGFQYFPEEWLQAWFIANVLICLGLTLVCIAILRTYHSHILQVASRLLIRDRFSQHLIQNLGQYASGSAAVPALVVQIVAALLDNLVAPTSVIETNDQLQQYRTDAMNYTAGGRAWHELMQQQSKGPAISTHELGDTRWEQIPPILGLDYDLSTSARFAEGWASWTKHFTMVLQGLGVAGVFFYSLLSLQPACNRVGKDALGETCDPWCKWFAQAPEKITNKEERKAVKKHLAQNAGGYPFERMWPVTWVLVCIAACFVGPFLLSWMLNGMEGFFAFLLWLGCTLLYYEGMLPTAQLDPALAMGVVTLLWGAVVVVDVAFINPLGHIFELFVVASIYFVVLSSPTFRCVAIPTCSSQGKRQACAKLCAPQPTPKHIVQWLLFGLLCLANGFTRISDPCIAGSNLRLVDVLYVALHPRQMLFLQIVLLGFIELGVAELGAEWGEQAAGKFMTYIKKGAKDAKELHRQQQDFENEEDMQLNEEDNQLKKIIQRAIGSWTDGNHELFSQFCGSFVEVSVVILVGLYAVAVGRGVSHRLAGHARAMGLESAVERCNYAIRQVEFDLDEYERYGHSREKHPRYTDLMEVRSGRALCDTLDDSTGELPAGLPWGSYALDALLDGKGPSVVLLSWPMALAVNGLALMIIVFVALQGYYAGTAVSGPLAIMHSVSLESKQLTRASLRRVNQITASATSQRARPSLAAVGGKATCMHPVIDDDDVVAPAPDGDRSRRMAFTSASRGLRELVQSIGEVSGSVESAARVVARTALRSVGLRESDISTAMDAVQAASQHREALQKRREDSSDEDSSEKEEQAPPSDDGVASRQYLAGPPSGGDADGGSVVASGSNAAAAIRRRRHQNTASEASSNGSILANFLRPGTEAERRAEDCLVGATTAAIHSGQLARQDSPSGEVPLPDKTATDPYALQNVGVDIVRGDQSLMKLLVAVADSQPPQVSLGQLEAIFHVEVPVRNSGKRPLWVDHMQLRVEAHSHADGGSISAHQDGCCRSRLKDLQKCFRNEEGSPLSQKLEDVIDILHEAITQFRRYLQYDWLGHSSGQRCLGVLAAVESMPFDGDDQDGREGGPGGKREGSSSEQHKSAASGAEPTQPSPSSYRLRGAQMHPDAGRNMMWRRTQHIGIPPVRRKHDRRDPARGPAHFVEPTHVRVRVILDLDLLHVVISKNPALYKGALMWVDRARAISGLVKDTISQVKAAGARFLQWTGFTTSGTGSDADSAESSEQQDAVQGPNHLIERLSGLLHSLHVSMHSTGGNDLCGLRRCFGGPVHGSTVTELARIVLAGEGQDVEVEDLGEGKRFLHTLMVEASQLYMQSSVDTEIDEIQGLVGIHEQPHLEAAMLLKQLQHGLTDRYAAEAKKSFGVVMAANQWRRHASVQGCNVTNAASHMQCIRRTAKVSSKNASGVERQQPGSTMSRDCYSHLRHATESLLLVYGSLIIMRQDVLTAWPDVAQDDAGFTEGEIAGAREVYDGINRQLAKVERALQAVIWQGAIVFLHSGAVHSAHAFFRGSRGEADDQSELLAWVRALGLVVLAASKYGLRITNPDGQAIRGEHARMREKLVDCKRLITDRTTSVGVVGNAACGGSQLWGAHRQAVPNSGILK